MSGGEGMRLQASNSETHQWELEDALLSQVNLSSYSILISVTVLLKALSASSDSREFDIFFLPSRELSG